MARAVQEEALLRQMSACKMAYSLLRVTQIELLKLRDDIEPGSPDGIVAGRRVVAGAALLNKTLDDLQGGAPQLH